MCCPNVMVLAPNCIASARTITLNAREGSPYIDAARTTRLNAQEVSPDINATSRIKYSS